MLVFLYVKFKGWSGPRSPSITSRNGNHPNWIPQEGLLRTYVYDGTTRWNWARGMNRMIFAEYELWIIDVGWVERHWWIPWPVNIWKTKGLNTSWTYIFQGLYGLEIKIAQGTRESLWTCQGTGESFMALVFFVGHWSPDVWQCLFGWRGFSPGLSGDFRCLLMFLFLPISLLKSYLKKLGMDRDFHDLRMAMETASKVGDGRCQLFPGGRIL